MSSSASELHSPTAADSPIIPTDLFLRETAGDPQSTLPRVKITFDVTCLAVTAGLTFLFLGHIKGLGIRNDPLLPLPWEK